MTPTLSSAVPLSRTSSVLRSVLPIEILDYILRSLARHELTVCLRLNSLFHDISARILYHAIRDLRALESVKCLLQLAGSFSIRPLVRCLCIDWATTTPTENLYRLLHSVLRRLPALKELSLEFPRGHGPLWILRGVPFVLKVFSTSMPSKQTLATFLHTQPTLTDLTLRGVNTDDFVAPFFTPPASLVADGRLSLYETRFVLNPDALPVLSSLRTIHGGPNVIRSVVCGRPVQVASVALFPHFGLESLRALGTSSAPMKRLSIMSFDPLARDYLLLELARRFPTLEALHIVILLAEYNTELLRASGSLLAGFKQLQYITFMAATNDSSTPEEEQDIAKLWHRWCPTLKTIILPRGKVWFGGPDNTMIGGSLISC